MPVANANDSAYSIANPQGSQKSLMKGIVLK